MIIELYNYGLGKDPLYTEGKNVQITIGAAFQILRADIVGGRYSESQALWGNLETSGTRHEDVASEILKKLKQKVDRIQQTDLDACIMAALSCGDPYTAVRLIQIADKFLPEKGESARASALSRLDSVKSFEKAYDFYPTLVKDRLDGVLASLGEGLFADFTEIPQALTLKQEAEKRLRDRLKKGRDDRYTSQAVINIDLREQSLDEEHLTTDIEQIVRDDKEWVDIEKIIKEKAGGVVIGRVANLIAAELQRRISPEYALDDQVDARKTEATKEGANKLYYGRRNEYEHGLFGSGFIEKNLSTSEKEEKIRQVYYRLDSDIVEEIFDPNRIGLKALVALLKNPDSYVFQVQTAIRHLGDHGDRFNKGMEMLAKKLVGGVSYLQALAEIPEMIQILQKEFGFGNLVTPDNLEKAAEQLQNMFGQVVDQESVLTLYESMLQEGQLEEDTRVAQQITAIIPVDVKRIVDEKKAETGNIIEEMTEKASGEQRILQRKKIELVEPLAQKSTIESNLSHLEAEQARVGNIRTVLFKVPLITDKNVMTETEKARQLIRLKTEIEAARLKLGVVESQINEIGVVSGEQINAMGKRVVALANLKSPQRETPASKD